MAYGNRNTLKLLGLFILTVKLHISDKNMRKLSILDCIGLF